jgi:hypothetical protein
MRRSVTPSPASLRSASAPLNAIVRFHQGGTVAKKRTGVLLFYEAAEMVKLPLAAYIRHNEFGYYFNCESIDASGPLLTMTVEPNDGIPGGAIQIQIQYSWVKFTLTSAKANPLGFGET